MLIKVTPILIQNQDHTHTKRNIVGRINEQGREGYDIF